MMNLPMIQCRGVSKSYHKGSTVVTPLEALDLDVPKGEFLALMGPSGSGKTTLLNLLSGIDSPTEGSLVIAGTEIAKTLPPRTHPLARQSCRLYLPALSSRAGAHRL
jgi:putative ABC transport system ATP-binding protein